MTWNAQPNRNDVLTSAKNTGYSVNGYHTIPDEWNIEIPNGGSATPSDLGTELTAGTTTGDTVMVETFQNYQAGHVDTMRVTWLFDTRHMPSPPVDHIMIGTGMSPDLSNNDGIFFDITNEIIHIAGTTFPFNLSMGNFDVFGLCIVYDRSAGEVAVELRSDNQSQVERANGSPSNEPYGVRVVSNGNGDNMSLLTNSLTLGYDWQI